MSDICYNTVKNEYQMPATVNGKRKFVPIHYIKPIDELAIRYFIIVNGKRQYLSKSEENELSKIIQWRAEL